MSTYPNMRNYQKSEILNVALRVPEHRQNILHIFLSPASCSSIPYPLEPPDPNHFNTNELAIGFLETNSTGFPVLLHKLFL